MTQTFDIEDICPLCKYHIANCRCDPVYNIYGIPMSNVDPGDLDEVEQEIFMALSMNAIDNAAYIGFNITWRHIKNLDKKERPRWD